MQPNESKDIELGKIKSFEEEFYNDDDDGLNYGRKADDSVSICISDPEMVEQIQFYRSIISPSIESYWIAASNLTTLIHQSQDYNQFVNQVIDSAKDHLRRGLLLFRKFHHLKIISASEISPNYLSCFLLAQQKKA